MIPIERFFVASDYREEPEAIGELALSIEKRGLIHPIAVKEVGTQYEVIAGRRRFYALRDYLKLTHLEEGKHFLVREGMDALVCQLVENIDRLDFKPIEAARLIKAIHDRGVQEHGRAIRGRAGGKGWTIADTAKLLGRTKGFISKMLKIASNEEVVEDASSINEALDIIERAEKKSVLSTIRKARVKRVKPIDIDSALSNYYNLDALTLLNDLDSSTVDLILTDPPYGIDLDTITPEQCYSDDRSALLSLLESCMPEFRRVIRPDKFIIIWTAFDLISVVIDLLHQNGFSPAPTPIIWVKPNTTGRSVQSTSRLGSVAECAVYATSGPGAELTEKGHGNVFSIPSLKSDRIHPAQKPETLLEALINIFSLKGDTVLDVFAGSASTLRACISTDRHFIGCEKDPDFFSSGLSYTLDWLRKFHNETYSEEEQ